MTEHTLFLSQTGTIHVIKWSGTMGEGHGKTHRYLSQVTYYIKSNIVLGPAVSSWSGEQSRPRPGTPGTEGSGQHSCHRTGTALSLQGQCWGPGKRLWQPPCHHSGRPAQGEEGGEEGRGCPGHLGACWPGGAAGPDTQQRGGGARLQAQHHSLGVGRHHSRRSSAVGGSMTGIFQTASWPVLSRP